MKLLLPSGCRLRISWGVENSARVGWLLALLVATFAPEIGAQVISPNIHVSAGAKPRAENEPTIAMLGEKAVAVWLYDSYERVRTAISRDGGQNWQPASIPPIDPRYEAGSGFPSVCIDGAGTAFCALYGTARVGDVSGPTILIYRASFDDPEWQWQRIANAIPLAQSQLFDGVKILCDQTTGTLYLVYTYSPDYYQGRIEFVRIEQVFFCNFANSYLSLSSVM